MVDQPRLIEEFETDSEAGGTTTVVASDLVAMVRRELDEMARHRDLTGFRDRYRNCLRLREGLYSPEQLAAIGLFGGSAVFVRVISNKIRGAAAMLREIYLLGETPYEIAPTPVPSLPEDVSNSINQLVQNEIMTLAAAGMPPDPSQVIERQQQLFRAAQDAARRQAVRDAKRATDYIEDIYQEGGFYEALDDFILDFCTFPVAILRGPTAQMETDVRYVNGKPQLTREPRLKFFRVDPWNIMWSAGALSIESANLIERIEMTRADLNALIGLEGYDEDSIRSIIRENPDGVKEWQFDHGDDASRDASLTSSFPDGIYDLLAFTGRMTGRRMEELGITANGEEPDPDLEYLLQIWTCGRFCIKVAVDPDPRSRVPYYSAAYEGVAGSITGTALPELITDIQDILNAVARSLVNNLSISSGPQVLIDMSMISDPQDAEQIWPWKRWKYEGDPGQPNKAPVSFFQPQAYNRELMEVFTFFTNLADEVSAIPRYMTGSDKIGGAGRTASGLSMLMSNAGRVMNSVAASIDNRIIQPLTQKTYDLVMLTTGTDVLRGDESIVVRGATFSKTREQDRMRLLEFLQLTGNPIDMQILGLAGRAKILAKVADTLGLEGEKVIPGEEELAAQQQQMQLQAAQQNLQGQQVQQGQGQQDGGGQGGNAPSPQPQKRDQNEVAAPTDNRHRTRNMNSPQR